MHYRLEFGDYLSELLVDEQSTQKCSTEKIADKFFSESIIPLGILPPVVRYLSSDFSLVVVERPPAHYSIQFKNARKATKASAINFNLPVPWQTYVISITKNNITQEYGCGLKVFFRPSQIWTIEDPLYFPYLPNLWSNGQSCLSTETYSLAKDAKTLSEIINIMIESFWSAEFNLDLTDFTSYSPFSEEKRIGPLQLLRKISALTIEEVLSADYARENFSVKSSQLLTPISFNLKTIIQQMTVNTTLTSSKFHLIQYFRNLMLGTEASDEEIVNGMAVQELTFAVDEDDELDDQYYDEEVEYDDDGNAIVYD